MKISSGNSEFINNQIKDVFWVHLEAESDEEAEYLYKFFKEDCKKIMKKFPLKDKNWKGRWDSLLKMEE